MGKQTIEQRVERGAAWLDEHESAWWRELDVDLLDLSSTCRCVLGQLDHDKCDVWESLLAMLGLRPFWEGGRRPSDAALGFNAYRGEYVALTDQWRQVIADRRSG